MADCKDKSYLLMQVCKHLDLEAQYVLVSSRRGVVVHEIPSDQFDHVMIRARIDDDHVYLDAANPYSVFSTPPVAYQGLKGLAIDEGQLIEIPVAGPEHNVISFGEEYSSIESGWLSGSFMLSADGQTARFIDENWKSLSMSAGGQKTTAQSLLQSFMNSATITDHRRLSDTSTSDRLEISGSLLRCRMSSIRDLDVAIIRWDEPFLPIYTWRSLHIQSHFAFLAPMEIRFRLAITGELVHTFHESSRITSLDNDLCSIRSGFIEDESAKVFQRSVTIKRKYVTPDLADQLGSTFEALEEAFSIAVSFRRS
jgi:hypothetical protein